MLISPAYAQAGGGLFDGGIAPLLPLVLIFVVFYFLLIRPQQKKMKQHRQMIAAVRRGDVVVTGGGIIGRVTRVVDESEVVVEIASGTKVRVARPTLAEVRAKAEPVPATKGQAKDEKIGAGRRIGGLNYYGVLGVKRSASSEQISASYKKLTKRYHPDANPRDEEATKRFEEISQAYEVLSNSDLREEYDSLGHEEFLAKYGK